jgi:two-component system, LytTR family, sensor kinase
MLSKRGLLSNKTLYYHISGWLVFFLLHYILFSSYEVKIDIFFQVFFWLSNIFLFYINYLVFIPYLLFNKRIPLYIFSLLAVLLLFYFSQSKVMDWQMEKKRAEQGFNFPDKMGPGAPENPRKDFKLPPGPPQRRGNAMVLYNVLLFFTASTAIRVMGKLEKEEKLKQDAESRKTLEELKQLKQQVNPHFLFNSLNSIYSLANQKSERTTEAVLKLSATLRYMLYDVNEPVVFLKNEIDHIRNFIELQKFRLTDHTQISLDISGDPDKFLIQPLLLIPFVENAFKFGVDNRRESFIHIEIRVEKGELHFTIRNKIVNEHGTGDSEKSGGIGLINVKRRLEILYPEEHKLKFTTEEEVFIVNLILKLNK